ncbi:hypothetical protein GCM10007160_39000 [Litchfieldella qijiaojingensis]|uniref:Uncharacterized protein n=1 Tax=Litchfieldella qijiaojingensis TaxID=980347 RepID=A0ABQ2ZAL0_9GAMM|nr:hypothetical protein [Halomonas qijiaojingensis]GGY07796.1 hypothetical protein GCM10007160_39000 [Halomonas qijiaojingensis]
MTTNPLVEFLASYGPQASSNNLYDEFVVEAAMDTGCAPLEIEQPLVNELASMFKSQSPRSVILTGTAGDGKTYTARKVVEAIAGPDAIWQTTDKIFDLSVPSCPERRIRFIKDLSELKEGDKDTLFPEVKASLLAKGSDTFVICVNDGHLLKFFRDREVEGVKLHDRIADMLQNDEEHDPNGHFRLINMSRQSHRDLFERILDGIVDHPGWAECTGCHALDSAEQPCPIRANLEILRQKDPASMRARLKDMIRMAAADGQHLSIRQLILLTVNILLGDQKPGKELLTCQKAKNRAADDDYCATNPYANAFGQNLRERQRRQYGAFAILEEFGIGLETNNFFDHSLLWDTDELPGDPIYGARIFASHRERYRIDPSANAQDFRREMLDQRRRLFFSIDPDSKMVREDPRRNPWNLSVFKCGATYIRLADGAEQGAVPRDIARDIIRGLNRMMTGEMTNTDDRLWLTEPSGVYLGREIPLLVAHAGRQREGPTFISFPPMQGNGKAPVLRFTPMQRGDLAVDLPLRPTLVECILRIANGALPASFSSECRRDIERFQLKAVTAIHEASRPHHPPPQEVEMVGGTLQSRPIAALVEEESW